MATKLKSNPIGESIYNRIKDYDITSRKVFLSNLTEEQRILYNKYKNMINKRNSLNKDETKRETQNKQAKERMKILRTIRTKEEIKTQRKPYDIKYREKKKLSKEQAVQIIQKQYRAKKQREEGEAIAKDIINDIINNAPNLKIVNGEIKKKRGKKIT